MSLISGFTFITLAREEGRALFFRGVQFIKSVPRYARFDIIGEEKAFGIGERPREGEGRREEAGTMK